MKQTSISLDIRQRHRSAASDLPVLEISAVERRELDRALTLSGLVGAFRRKALPPLETVRAKLRKTIATYGLASTEFGRALGAFGERRTNTACLIITGAPQGVSTKLFLALVGELLGQIDHIPEEGGYLIEVSERPDQKPGRPSFANNEPFALHIDLSYAPSPPTIMLLQAVRNSPEDAGYSVLADVNEAIALLDRRTVQELLLPNFLFPAPAHFNGSSHVKAPILSVSPYHDAQYFVRFRRDALQTATRGALLAVNELVDALDEVKVEFMLGESSIICADNRRVLHGRTGFLSNLERARALNRMYVKGRTQ